MVVQLSAGPLQALRIETLIGVAVFYYSFFLSLDDEFRLIWKRRVSTVSVLILAVRYITFVAYIPTLLFLFDRISADVPATESKLAFGAEVLKLAPTPFCSVLLRFPATVGVLCNALILTLLLIRTFAIYESRLWIIGVVAPPGVLTIAGGIIMLFKLAPADIVVPAGIRFSNESFACLGSENMTSISISLYRISSISIILFGTIVFALTLYRTLTLSRQIRRFGQGSKLIHQIMRDGTVFYLVIVALDVTGYILFEAGLQSSPNLPTFYVSYSGGFSEISHSLAVTLMSRMVFNLRDEGIVGWEVVNRTGGERYRPKDESAIWTASAIRFTTNDDRTAVSREGPGWPMRDFGIAPYRTGMS